MQHFLKNEFLLETLSRLGLFGDKVLGMDIW